MFPTQPRDVISPACPGSAQDATLEPGLGKGLAWAGLVTLASVAPNKWSGSTLLKPTTYMRVHLIKMLYGTGSSLSTALHLLTLGHINWLVCMIFTELETPEVSWRAVSLQPGYAHHCFWLMTTSWTIIYSSNMIFNGSKLPRALLWHHSLLFHTCSWSNFCRLTTPGESRNLHWQKHVVWKSNNQIWSLFFFF